MRNVRKVPMPVLEHTMNISVYFGVQLIQYTLDNVAQRLKRLPAMWETRVQSLGWEDSPGEGNSNPLQYSCLENPMEGRAW